MTPLIARGRRRSFQRRVIDWYAVYGRDLPWRRTRDPYAILVSEVLSHQTQIARVVPVYERLLERYPTVTALARAPPFRRRWRSCGAFRESGAIPPAR